MDKKSGIYLGGGLQKFLREINCLNPDFNETMLIQKAWYKVIDKELLEHVNALFVIPNTHASEIIVYVDSSLLATELNLQSELIKLKLNQKLLENKNKEKQNSEEKNDSLFNLKNCEKIKKLQFKLSKETYTKKGSVYQNFSSLEEEKIQPIPLSEDEIKKLKKAAEEIEDPKLRELAFKTARANLEYKKGSEIKLSK